MTRKKKNTHIGSALNEFLKAVGVLDDFRAVAAKEVIAWQIQEAMTEKHLSKNKMAELMNTSRAQLDRLLDPTRGNDTLETLQRVAQILGRELHIKLR